MKYLFLALVLLVLAPFSVIHAQDSSIDLTALPLGDYKVSDSPHVGYIWSCTDANAGAGGAQAEGPWINTAAGTYDLTAKAVVDGDVAWDGVFTIALDGSNRVLTGNGVPEIHNTGIFPIAAGDDAYQYDRNPNSISEQQLTITLPANPVLAAQPSCVGGSVGVMLSGVMLFNGLDALQRDAVAYETQDACAGHPERTGSYHYHNLSDCLADDETSSEHSPLYGYAFDGFGIYGHQGENGQALTNADLDECHGHTHMIEWDGQMVEMYHYHATYEYPYTVGCYRGTPAAGNTEGGMAGAGVQPPAGAAGGQNGQQPPLPPPGGQGGMGGQQPPPPGGQGSQNGQPPPPPPSGGG